jgi:hypothetical protein
MKRMHADGRKNDTVLFPFSFQKFKLRHFFSYKNPDDFLMKVQVVETVFSTFDMFIRPFVVALTVVLLTVQSIGSSGAATESSDVS